MNGRTTHAHWAIDLAPDPRPAHEKALLRAVVSALREPLEIALDELIVTPRIVLVCDERAIEAELARSLDQPLTRATDATPDSTGRGHVAVVVGAGQSDDECRHRLARAWSHLKPAGRLIVLANVVPQPGSPPRDLPIGTDRLLHHLIEVTGSALVLEDVRSIRWPLDVLRRGVVITATSLHVPPATEEEW